MIIETFRQALQNVWSNKLRTFLTMLGIIIGVMAVIVIVGLGNGMTQSMRDSFSALGTNALSIQVWGYGSRTASVEDVYKIADKNKELISAVSPQIDFSNNTPKVGTTTYRYGTSVYGVDEHYAEMKNYTLAQGRGLQYMDIKDNKQVCIIGDYLNRAAYGGNAVGQTIKLGAYKFRIVGVLNAKVTDKNYETTKIADFPIRIYVACNGKNCPSKSYKDVDQTQWYHNAVDYVLGNDLMKGTGKTTFSPDATLTRGMVVTVLGRAAGVKTADYAGTSFSDVKAGSWYAPYVQWASKQGLVKGYEDGTFKPEQNVTREEMVTMLFRCWQSEGNTWKTDVAALNAYKDSAKVSSWALPAMPR